MFDKKYYKEKDLVSVNEIKSMILHRFERCLNLSMISNSEESKQKYISYANLYDNLYQDICRLEYEKEDKKPWKN